MSEQVTAFYGIFEEKYKKLKAKLSEQLKESKSKRNKKFIKSLLKEAKELKQVLKKSTKAKVCCPNCGHVLN